MNRWSFERLSAVGTRWSWTLLGASVVIGGCAVDATDTATLDEPATLGTSDDMFSTVVNIDSTGGAAEGSGWCPVAGQAPVAGQPQLDFGRVPVGRENLSGVSVYQGVEVELPWSGTHGTDLVAGRQTLVRVFVSPLEQVHGARLVLLHSDGSSTLLEEERVLSRASSKPEVASTYNFIIPKDRIDARTSLAIELFAYAPCAGWTPPATRATFPSQGSYALGAREVGTMEIVLVPVRYDADGSGRLPDTSARHVNTLREHLQAMYPVRDVELRIHEPVATLQTTMEGVLSQLLHLRSLEQPRTNVAYFGLVNPAESMAEFCEGSCVAGVSAIGSSSGEASAGVGVGFLGPAQETFLHELGHMNRLDHSPCGDPSDPDLAYPHPHATLGSWGYDSRDRRLIDPSGHFRDFMSYCDPTWISDYNYQKLIDHLSLVNALPQADVVSWNRDQQHADDDSGEHSFGSGPGSAWGERPTFTMILEAPDGSLRHTPGLIRRPRGEVQRGWLVDESGDSLAMTTITQQQISEGRGRILYIPTPPERAVAVRFLDGTSVALL